MKKKGIHTAQDFVEKDMKWVSDNFSKPYTAIWQELNCIMVMEIDAVRKTIYSSIQKTRTFHPPTNNKAFLLSQLSKNIEDACTKARYYKLKPKKFSIFLKTQNFQYINCLVQLSPPTNAPEIIISLAHEKFKEMHKMGVLYRTTGVTLQDLALNSFSQGDLFGNRDRANKFESIHKRLDSLEDKFGKRVVYLASTEGALRHKEKGTEAEELDRNLLFL